MIVQNSIDNQQDQITDYHNQVSLNTDSENLKLKDSNPNTQNELKFFEDSYISKFEQVEGEESQKKNIGNES